MHYFLRVILWMKRYMFRTVPLSIIRSFSLYTQQWYMSGSGWNRSSILILLASCQETCIWHIPLLYVQWKTPDDGQRNCRKHVEFHSKNKIWEISASGWFVIRRKVVYKFTSVVLSYLRGTLSEVSVVKELKKVCLKGPIHCQLNWSILLCDVIPWRKNWTKVRSFDRQ